MTGKVKQAPRPHLRFVGFSQRTRVAYLRAIQAFFAYLRLNGAPRPSTFQELDLWLSEFVNECWQLTLAT